MRKVTKVYTNNATWTAPAGVRSVVVQTTNVTQEMHFPTGIQNAHYTQTVLNQAGRMFTCGTNANGQLGDVSVAMKSSPVTVVGSLTFKKAIVHRSLLGLTTSGDMYACGFATNGELGDGTAVAKSSPALVAGSLKFVNFWTQLASSTNSSTFAITEQGALYSWGQNVYGVLGDNSTTKRSSPVLVVGGLTFRQIFLDPSAFATVLGLTTSGDLYAWGSNFFGSCGDGTITQRSSPVIVAGGLKWAAASIYASTVLAVTTSGDLYCWGQGTYGIGNGTTNHYSSPVLVAGGLKWATNFDSLAADNQNYRAITRDGAMYAWGNNTNGQLGDVSVAHKSSPVAVVGSLRFVATAQGGAHVGAVGITKVGVAYTWGNPQSGVLGDGTTTAKSSPVAVAGSLKAFRVWGGSAHRVMAADNGTAYSWGAGNNGCNGDNSITPRSSPVAVAGAMFARNLVKSHTTQIIPVIPGVSYTIRFEKKWACFGSEVLGDSLPESISITYEA